MIKVSLVLCFLWIAAVIVLFRCDAVSANPRDVQWHTASPEQQQQGLIHSAVNDYRTANGLAPLQWSSYWTQLATDHAADNAGSGILSHSGTDGRTFRERVEDYEQQQGESGCYVKGENIAKRSIRSGDTPRSIAAGLTQQWIGSDPHRINMSRSIFTSGSVGIAYSYDSRGRQAIVAVQVFCGY